MGIDFENIDWEESNIVDNGERYIRYNIIFNVKVDENCRYPLLGDYLYIDNVIFFNNIDILNKYTKHDILKKCYNLTSKMYNNNIIITVWIDRDNIKLSNKYSKMKTVGEILRVYELYNEFGIRI